MPISPNNTISRYERKEYFSSLYSSHQIIYKWNQVLYSSLRF